MRARQRRDFAGVELLNFCLKESVAQLANRQSVCLRPQSAARKQIVALLKPLR
jgi:hypothetical protein